MQGGHSLIELAATKSAPESFFWHTLLYIKEECARLPGTIVLPGTRHPRCLPRVGGLLVVAFLSIGFYAIAQVAGVYMARLLTTNFALSEHPDCGVYLPDLKSPRVLRITDPVELKMQEDSGFWARRCFGVTGTPDGCNEFIYKDMPFMLYNTTCPWSGGMCHENGTSALRLTTGNIDARRIGINSPVKLEFNRTTECSPVNMNSTFIPIPSIIGNEPTWRYYYGPMTVYGNASFASRHTQDIEDSPGYTVNGLWHDTVVENQGWTPLPELQPKKGSTLTFIFVQSRKMLYDAPRNDPVFPTTAELPVNGEQYYINLQGHVTVMGCVDTTLWRFPNLDQAWKRIDTDPPSNISAQTKGALLLLRLSLISSNTWSAFHRRLAAAFDAQSKVAGYVSLPLAEEQWKVEAEQLFKISLARIMVNAKSIARGALKQPGWQKVNITEDYCHETFLMNAIGWSNVTPLPVLCILVATFLLIIAALPLSEEELLFEKISHVIELTRNTKIVEIVGGFVYACCVAVLNGMRECWYWPGWAKVRKITGKIVRFIYKILSNVIGAIWKTLSGMPAAIRDAIATNNAFKDWVERWFS